MEKENNNNNDDDTFSIPIANKPVLSAPSEDEQVRARIKERLNTLSDPANDPAKLKIKTNAFIALHGYCLMPLEKLAVHSGMDEMEGCVEEMLQDEGIKHFVSIAIMNDEWYPNMVLNQQGTRMAAMMAALIVMKRLNLAKAARSIRNGMKPASKPKEQKKAPTNDMMMTHEERHQSNNTGRGIFIE